MSFPNTNTNYFNTNFGFTTDSVFVQVNKDFSGSLPPPEEGLFLAGTTITPSYFLLTDDSNFLLAGT